jgi:hypothetical protein
LLILRLIDPNDYTVRDDGNAIGCIRYEGSMAR